MLVLTTSGPPTAGNPLWKKHKTGGKVPHLSRWFDHIASVPDCLSAAEELVAMDSKKVRAAAAPVIAVSGSAGNGGDKQSAAGASMLQSHLHVCMELASALLQPDQVLHTYMQLCFPTAVGINHASHNTTPSARSHVCASCSSPGHLPPLPLPFTSCDSLLQMLWSRSTSSCGVASSSLPHQSAHPLCCLDAGTCSTSNCCNPLNCLL